MSVTVALHRGIEPAELFDWAVDWGVRLSAMIPAEEPLEALFATLMQEQT